MLVDEYQAHLELSVNIIDFTSESLTSKKEASARTWAPHNTPLSWCIVSFTNSCQSPFSSLLRRKKQAPAVSPEGCQDCYFSKCGEEKCLRKVSIHSKGDRMSSEKALWKRTVTMEMNECLWFGVEEMGAMGGHHRGYQRASSRAKASV